MAAYGTIIARVYTSDAYLPLREAPVTFTQMTENGGQKLLAVRLTDQSGLTEPVLIETPERQQSLKPESQLKPFAAVNLYVEYPGYQSLRVMGIQIFPEVETIQGLQLRPLSISQYEMQRPVVYGPSAQNL